MKDKKVMILIVLAAGAVISLIYGIVTPPKYERNISAAEKTAAVVEPVLRVEKIVPTERHSRPTKFTAWSRNPFAPKGSDAAKGVDLSLNGIMYFEDSPKAMINDEIVAVGDKIGSYAIVDIKADRVVVNDGKADFELKLE